MELHKRIKIVIDYLRKPAVGWSVLSLGGMGLLLGVVSTLGFQFSLEVTNTEAFCTSCHEMSAQPYQAVQKTSHYNNRSGVRPTCSDCHVPHKFIPKMIRKIEASREVWGHLIGLIDTPEKYAEQLGAMKGREIDRMRNNDSNGCRTCHDVERMVLAQQTSKAQKYHQVMKAEKKTCIDCHQGIAHSYDEAHDML